jgi:hypothetical protein
MGVYEPKQENAGRNHYVNQVPGMESFPFKTADHRKMFRHLCPEEESSGNLQ